VTRTGTGSPARVTQGPLSVAAAGEVLALADAATAADGVAPLSEDALLQVRHGSKAGAVDLVLSVASNPGDTDSGAGDTARDTTRDTARDTSAVVAGYAHLDAPDESTADEEPGDFSGELTVHPGYRRRGFGTLLASALTSAADGRGIRIWAHGDLPGAAGLARSAGFTRVRSLWQMRIDLADAVLSDAVLSDAVLPAGISVRTFQPGKDEQSWLAVNHAAFAHHPEQGSWTMSDLLLREAEPWFDPAGFFLAERDGRLAGFHWTKVHQPGSDASGERIGEVYVVGVDPGEQGGGLGRALTLAGLSYLRGLGLAQVMLYVDESNTAAVKMYTGLGFRRWSTDVMYRRA
jgi:mycothiol synthase